MNQKHLLFNPGPTNVSNEVRNALVTPDMSHRDPVFKEVMTRINENIVKILGGEEEYSAVFFISSGTGANEAMINPIEGKILVINHGRYSARLRDITERYRIPYVDFEIPELELLELDALERQIKQDPEITHILMVHHETTTAMIEPLKEIGDLCKKYRKILMVDAISSIGGHHFNLKEFNIGLCTLSANKALEGFPGVSFVIAKNEILQQLKEKSRSFYFDLYYQWECQKKNRKMPYTAAIQVVFALDVAIQRLVREGYENRVHRYKRLAIIMRDGLKSLGFEVMEHQAGRQANILTMMKVPEDFDYYLIRDLLKRSNITIYTDKKSLEKKRMFVATMGDLSEEEIYFFLARLKEAICNCQITSSLTTICRNEE